MKKNVTLALLALTVMGSTAAYAGDKNSVLDNLFNTVKTEVNRQFDKLTGKSTTQSQAAATVRDAIEDEQFTGRFVTASGPGMDVTIDFAESGMYRRKDIYLKSPNEPALEMGTWTVDEDGTIVLTSTLGDVSSFTYRNHKLQQAGATATASQLSEAKDVDLFDDRAFLLDLDDTMTIEGDEHVITFAGDGTYRMAEPAGAKAHVHQGRWAQLGNGVITLLGDEKQIYMAPYRNSFVITDDQGNMPKDAQYLDRSNRIDLFKTYFDLEGTLTKVEKDYYTFMTNDGMTYDVDLKNSVIDSLKLDDVVTVAVMVNKPTDDDTRGQVFIEPSQN